MKKSSTIIFVVILNVLLTSSCQRCGVSGGTITIVNTSLEKINVTLDDKRITIAPEQHYTQKEVLGGVHNLRIGTGPKTSIVIKRNLTTVVDLSADNCYIVADFTEQYGEKGTGEVKILEKFNREPLFTTATPLTANLGAPLPNEEKSYKDITRIHRIDCNWIDNDEAIVEAIANIP